MVLQTTANNKHTQKNAAKQSPLIPITPIGIEGTEETRLRSCELL